MLPILAEQLSRQAAEYTALVVIVQTDCVPLLITTFPLKAAKTILKRVDSTISQQNLIDGQ